jgi:hypothetical protein
LVKSESLGEKILIHNYGHGGCGVTLSWGTADMAAKLALKTPHRKAAVIGCGVIGLTTARLLQDRGFTVAIYASDLPPNTTSDVAAGAFGLTEIVSADHETNEIDRRLAEAVRFSHRCFESLGERYGVRPMVMYMLGSQPIEAPWEFAITPELFQFEILGPGKHSFPSTYASRFTTLMAETNTLMPALLADFRGHGGSVETRSFADKSARASASRLSSTAPASAPRPCSAIRSSRRSRAKSHLLSRNPPSPTPISIRCSISTCFRAAMAWCSAAAMNSATGQPTPIRAARRKSWKDTL